MKQFLFIKSATDVTTLPASAFSHAEYASAASVTLFFKSNVAGGEGSVAVTLAITSGKASEVISSISSQVANSNSFVFKYDAVKNTYFTSNVTGITSITTTTPVLSTQLTQEQVEDFAGPLVATGGTKTNIAVTYDDANGNMDFVVASDLNTTGNAATATLAADATTLATPRAINGVDFDGSAAITVTAAGSTLSDTVTVAKGGTGATSLTDNAVLLGNGTGAVEASSHLSYYSPGNNIDYLRIGDGSTTFSGITSENAAPLSIQVDNSAGTNVDGGNLNLIAGSGTGSGDGGDIIFKSSPAGGSGTTVGTLAEIASLDNVGNLQIDGALTLGTDLLVQHGGTGLSTVATNTFLTGNGTGDLTSEANLTYDGTNLQLASSVASAPDLILLSTSNHLTGSNLIFNKLRADDTPADNDFIGTIFFQGEDDGGNSQIYGTMSVQSNETEAGEEDGKLTMKVAAHDGGLASGLILEGGDVDDEVDVTIAKGAASVTTVAGTLTMGSTAFVNNSGVVQVATQGTIDHDSLANFASNEHYTQANIVATGTIASGTWEGTDVGVAHGGTGASNLDAFGLLAGTQTFTGKKIINTRSFPISSGTDGNAIGDVVYFGGTTSMTIGRIYHYKDDGTWELANPNAVATSDGLLAVALGAASDTNGMLLRGMVTLDHDTGAVGDVLYLDEQQVASAYGAATSGAPAGNNDIVRVVGYCLHASNGQIWFNPDSTFVEVTA